MAFFFTLSKTSPDTHSSPCIEIEHHIYLRYNDTVLTVAIFLKVPSLKTWLASRAIKTPHVTFLTLAVYLISRDCQKHYSRGLRTVSPVSFAL